MLIIHSLYSWHISLHAHNCYSVIGSCEVMTLIGKRPNSIGQLWDPVYDPAILPSVSSIRHITFYRSEKQYEKSLKRQASSYPVNIPKSSWITDTSGNKRLYETERGRQRVERERQETEKHRETKIKRDRETEILRQRGHQSQKYRDKDMIRRDTETR